MRHIAQFKDLVAALILSFSEDYDGKRNHAASIRCVMTNRFVKAYHLP